MDDTTQPAKVRSTRKAMTKKEPVANPTDTTALEATIKTLTKKCESLEARCSKLENSKPPSSSSGSDEEKWDRLKLFLEKKYGRATLKECGIWQS